MHVYIKDSCQLNCMLPWQHTIASLWALHNACGQTQLMWAATGVKPVLELMQPNLHTLCAFSIDTQLCKNMCKIPHYCCTVANMVGVYTHQYLFMSGNKIHMYNWYIIITLCVPSCCLHISWHNLESWTTITTILWHSVV